jgi:hypothetical protein
LIVGKILEPCAAAVHGIGQERKDFSHRHGHGLGRRLPLLYRSGGFGFWTVVNLKSISGRGHSVILDEVGRLASHQRPMLKFRVRTLIGS